MKSDSVVVLPASIESRKIIEAFVRWSEVVENHGTLKALQIICLECKNGQRVLSL